jgi:uncharacterized protein with FMN-binding domain
MKKIFLSTVFVVAFVAYALYATIFSQQKAVPAPQKTPDNSGNSNANQSAGQNQNPSQALSYKDGDYTGNSADAYYGNVQVKVSIKNHLIADVQFLDYPNDRSESLRVSQYAMPILTSEAIKAQNANVDIVSGATQTSQAFIESLKSALALAKA